MEIVVILLPLVLLFGFILVPIVVGRMISGAVVSFTTRKTQERVRAFAERHGLQLGEELIYGGTGIAFTKDRANVVLASGQAVSSFRQDQVLAVTSSSIVRKRMKRYLLDLTVRDTEHPTYRVAFPNEATWLRWTGLLD